MGWVEDIWDRIATLWNARIPGVLAAIDTITESVERVKARVLKEEYPAAPQNIRDFIIALTTGELAVSGLTRVLEEIITIPETPGITAPPYVCPFDGQTFTDQDEYFKHIMGHLTALWKIPGVG